MYMATSCRAGMGPGLTAISPGQFSPLLVEERRFWKPQFFLVWAPEVSTGAVTHHPLPGMCPHHATPSCTLARSHPQRSSASTEEP